MAHHTRKKHSSATGEADNKELKKPLFDENVLRTALVEAKRTSDEAYEYLQGRVKPDSNIRYQ